MELQDDSNLYNRRSYECYDVVKLIFEDQWAILKLTLVIDTIFKDCKTILSVEKFLTFGLANFGTRGRMKKISIEIHVHLKGIIWKERSIDELRFHFSLKPFVRKTKYQRNIRKSTVQQIIRWIWNTSKLRSPDIRISAGLWSLHRRSFIFTFPHLHIS